MCLLLRQVVMFGGGEQSNVALEPRHLFPSSKTLFCIQNFISTDWKKYRNPFVVDASPNVIQGVDLIGLNPASAAEDLILLCSGSLPLGVNFLLV